MERPREGPRVPADERPEPLDGDRVRVPMNRCPYCHEGVGRETADVCRDCLARHHSTCWAEGLRCGACGSSHVLRPVRQVLTTAIAREVLLAHGYPEDEIEQVVSRADEQPSCGQPGCGERGVARGGESPSLYCGDHARTLRRGNSQVGVSLLLFGIAMVLTGVGIAALVRHPLPLLLSAFGSILLVMASIVFTAVRGLPPIDEGREPRVAAPSVKG